LWFVETNAVATLPRELGAADTCASETSKPGAPGEALDLAELPEQLIVCSLRSLSEYSIDHELLYETHLHLRRVYLASDSCGAAEWTEHDWERAHSKIVN
jgi:hypothetical protein